MIFLNDDLDHILHKNHYLFFLVIFFTSNVHAKKFPEGYPKCWQDDENPINNKIAFVGNNGMSSDIYIYDLDTDTLTNLTNDWFSDIQVSWHPNGRELLIVSDRGDHLKTGFRGNSFTLFGRCFCSFNGRISRRTLVSNVGNQPRLPVFVYFL